MAGPKGRMSYTVYGFVCGVTIAILSLFAAFIQAEVRYKQALVRCIELYMDEYKVVNQLNSLPFKVEKR